ncbi:hypothetical protein MSAS_05270 [Mycobacterium saskatchewanense]|nr:hypothetical protein [Mycobacterium saskatchewanense]BBX61353.1 hypothetical protein MSAS_05270 [Mycobacterium saskatchewanense]
MTEHSVRAAAPRNTALGLISWLWVGVPFAYGLYELVVKIPALFTH